MKAKTKTAAKPSASTALKELPFGASRWTSGFFADMFNRGKTATRDSLKMALWHSGNSASFNDFKNAAALKAKRKQQSLAVKKEENDVGLPKPAAAVHQGTFWGDGDCYKYLEGLSHIYSALDAGAERDSIKAELDELLALVASAQEDDGYLNTQIQIPGKPRWVIRRHHEDYNLGHMFTAAAVHYAATGEKSFLNIARRAADCTYAHFIHRRRDAGQFGWNPTHIPGLVDLYRATGDARYLELACVFLDHRGAERPFQLEAPDTQKPDDQNQMALPFRDETEAVGHAVTAGYLYQGAAEIYRETGDATLLEAATRIWNDIVGNKMYLTGAVGALPMGISKRGFNVHEAFGREYELPHRTAYNETCANIIFGMFARSMFLISGDARQADVMEQVVYNSGISGMSVDGASFCYANPLRSYAAWHTAQERVGTMHNFTFDRWKVHTCYCCPPQQFRLMVQLQNWAYCTAPGSVYVALYGAGTATVDVPGTGTFQLRQETKYPWDGAVAITVEKAPAKEASIQLRIPGWCTGATARLNGKELPSVAEASPGSFAAIKRKWKSGDQIVLDLPMPVQLVVADPKVETCRGQAAVRRGPIVYCAESVDLPKGVKLEDVALAGNFGGVAIFDPKLFGGVATIEGNGKVLNRTGTDLYRTLGTAPGKEITLKFIPYYAWNNRGRSDMTVWLTMAQG